MTCRLQISQVHDYKPKPSPKLPPFQGNRDLWDNVLTKHWTDIRHRFESRSGSIEGERTFGKETSGELETGSLHNPKSRASNTARCSSKRNTYLKQLSIRTSHEYNVNAVLSIFTCNCNTRLCNCTSVVSMPKLQVKGMVKEKSWFIRNAQGQIVSII